MFSRLEFDKTLNSYFLRKKDGFLMNGIPIVIVQKPNDTKSEVVGVFECDRIGS